MPMRARVMAMFFTLIAGTAVIRADWTAVASTGTIDEGDLSQIALNTDGSAEIRPTINSTSAKIRDNVVAGRPSGCNTATAAAGHRASTSSTTATSTKCS